VECYIIFQDENYLSVDLVVHHYCQAMKKSKVLIITLVVFLIGLWIADEAYKKLYLYADKKPFWSGTELVQVCKIPYYSGEECLKELVTLIDGETALIRFKNKKNITTSDFDCKFAFRPFPDQPRYVFCRTWDSEGQQWDLMPEWAYYPSGEDLTKRMEKYDY